MKILERKTEPEVQEEPEVSQAPVVEAFQWLAEVLGSRLDVLSQQIDLLIRLETGAQNKHQLRDRIVAGDKRRAEAEKMAEAMQAEMDAQAEAEGDPITDDQSPTAATADDSASELPQAEALVEGLVPETARPLSESEVI